MSMDEAKVVIAASMPDALAGSNGLVMFCGIDLHKAMVEVSLTGVSLRGRDGKIGPAEGPVKLRVAHISSLDRP
jgi:hypothetical protein